MLLKRLITQLVNAAYRFSDARGIVPRPSSKGLVTNDDEFMGDLADADQRIGGDPTKLRPDYYGNLGRGVRKNVTAPNLNDPNDQRGSELRKKIIPELWKKTRDEHPSFTSQQIQQYIFNSLEMVRSSLPLDQQPIFEQQLTELLASIAQQEDQAMSQIEQGNQQAENIDEPDNYSVQTDEQGRPVAKISKEEHKLINKCMAKQIHNTLVRKMPVSFSLTDPSKMTGEFALIGKSPRLAEEYRDRMEKIRQNWAEDPQVIYDTLQSEGFPLPLAIDPKTGQKTRPLTYDEFATIEDLVAQKPAMNQKTLDDLRQKEGEEHYQHMMTKMERDNKKVDDEIGKIFGVLPQEEVNAEESLEIPEALMPKDLKMWASKLPSTVYEEMGMNSDQIYRAVERLSRPDQRKFVKQLRDMSYTGSEKQHVSLQQENKNSGEEITIDPVANNWQEEVAGRRSGWESMTEEEAQNVEQKKGHGIKQIQDLYDSINSVGQSVINDLNQQIRDRQNKEKNTPPSATTQKLIEVRNFLAISIPYVAKGIDAFSKKGIREIFENPDQLAEFRNAGITVSVIEGDKRRKITLQPGALGDVSDRTAIEIGPAVSWDKVDLSKLLGMRSQVDMVKEFIASLDKSKPEEFGGEHSSYDDLLYRSDKAGGRKERNYEELSKVSEFGIRHLSNWIEQNLHPKEGQRSAVNPSVFKAFMQIIKPRRAVIDRAILTSESTDPAEKISAARKYLASFFKAQYLTHKRTKKDKNEPPVFHKVERQWHDPETKKIPKLNAQGIQQKKNEIDKKSLDAYLQGNPVYSIQGADYAAKPEGTFAFQQLRATGPFIPIERFNQQTGQKEQIRPGLTEDDFFPGEDGTPPSVTDADIMNVLPKIKEELEQSGTTTGYKEVQRIYEAPAWDNAIAQAYIDFVDRLFKLADIRNSLSKFGSVDMVDALIRKARYDLKFKLHRIRKSYEDYMRM